MIIYFSGTGNSRFAAEYLAKKLGDEVLDAGKQIKAGEKGIFSSQTPLIFAAPIYGWQLPHLFADYIRSARFSGNQKAYFVLTCGSDIGDAAHKIEKLSLKNKNFIYHGTLGVVMPENYIAMFQAPQKEKAIQIVSEAKPILQKAASLIQAGQNFPEIDPSIPDQLKSGIVNRFFYRFFVKASPFYSKDSCIGCGKCVSACPLNNVALNNGRPVWGKNCTHCMACICGCPTEAIEYGRKSKGKPRYQCPEEP